MAKGNETVQVVRKPKVDKLSSAPAADEETFDLEQCQVVPRQSFEEGRGWIAIDGWEIWCFKEPEREVLHTDSVRVRGELYAVEGVPARFDKRGVFKALKVTVQRSSRS